MDQNHSEIPSSISGLTEELSPDSGPLRVITESLPAVSIHLMKIFS